MRIVFVKINVTGRSNFVIPAIKDNFNMGYPFIPLAIWIPFWLNVDVSPYLFRVVSVIIIEIILVWLHVENAIVFAVIRYVHIPLISGE